MQFPGSWEEIHFLYTVFLFESFSCDLMDPMIIWHMLYNTKILNDYAYIPYSIHKIIKTHTYYPCFLLWEKNSSSFSSWKKYLTSRGVVKMQLCQSTCVSLFESTSILNTYIISKSIAKQISNTKYTSQSNRAVFQTRDLIFTLSLLPNHKHKYRAPKDQFVHLDRSVIIFLDSTLS